MLQVEIKSKGDLDVIINLSNKLDKIIQYMGSDRTKQINEKHGLPEPRKMPPEVLTGHISFRLIMNDLVTPTILHNNVALYVFFITNHYEKILKMSLQVLLVNMFEANIKNRED